MEKEDFLWDVQQCFRKTRSGSDNSFVLNTVLWKAGALRKKVHLGFVDLKKVFDKVSQEKLWSRLQQLGFKDSFLGCIQALYCKNIFVTEFKGVWTLPIFLGRGLRQGCSLSPMLFAINVSAWGEELMASEEGFKIERLVVSILFFADDIVLILLSPEEMHRMLAISEKHCKLLRMTISEKKARS